MDLWQTPFGRGFVVHSQVLSATMRLKKEMCKRIYSGAICCFWCLLTWGNGLYCGFVVVEMFPWKLVNGFSPSVGVFLSLDCRSWTESKQGLVLIHNFQTTKSFFNCEVLVVSYIFRENPVYINVDFWIHRCQFHR